MATIYGTNSAESIYGEWFEADIIFGKDGDDHIFGRGGNDILKGGGGADELWGGSGVDTADYSDSTEGVTIDLMTGHGRHGSAEGDYLLGIENLTGSRYNDRFFGHEDANVLSGGSGLDSLFGLDGDDTLKGGTGSDALIGGAGADVLDGGDDSDSVDYADSPVGVGVNLATGAGHFGTAEGDTLISIEAVFGSSHDDVLVGNDLPNSLQGGGGADSLIGGGGSDNLWGGPGIDYLWGGSQRDFFRWTATSQTGVTPATADIIFDFNPAERDRIDLGAIDADIYASGDQAFNFIGTAAFTLNPATPETTDVLPGEINYYHAGGNTYIQLQTGTSPDAEAVIRLNGLHVPEDGWFQL